MAYWILPISARPISCTTVQRLTNLEEQVKIWKDKIQTFDKRVKKILDAPSAQLNIDPHLIQSGKLLSLDDEDSESI